jgi:hypothetical protein
MIKITDKFKIFASSLHDRKIGGLKLDPVVVTIAGKSSPLGLME